jgi:uncharacterized membrane protein YbhN (UPF0104 family)
MDWIATTMNKTTKQRIRLSITIFIIVLTISAFVYYISRHKSLLTQLGSTPLSKIVEIMLLYVAWFMALAGVLQASIRICKKQLAIKESFLLNAYSTLVNFFVPGQGGIAVRGVYLKKLKDLKVRNYIFTTLIYYMFYAIVSIVLLLVDNRPWWQTICAIALVSGLSYVVVRLYQKRSKTILSELSLSAKNLVFLFLCTVLQAIIQTAIYSVELEQVNQHIKLSQAITYTGAANFSLFVSLTPGAIGIRESFLIFSQRLHHISNANIVSANIIDRGVFIVFLGILFLLTLGFHARYRSVFTKSAAKDSAEDAVVAEASVK